VNDVRLTSSASTYVWTATGTSPATDNIDDFIRRKSPYNIQKSSFYPS